MTQETATPGRRVHEALTAVLRWGSRGDVRRSLLGEAGSGLSPTDTWLLGAVATRGPLRLSDLAAWQGVDKSTITPQVRRLEDLGLVRRQSDPADRRAALLTVTARGRQVQRRMSTSGAALVDDVLDDWSDADREALAVLLTRFAEQLSERRVGTA